MITLLIILSFLFSLTYISSQSWALLDCTTSVIFHNCFGFHEWKNDKMNGPGIMFYPSGDRYLGEYKDAKKHGYGIYEWANGNNEVGEFKNGKLNGYATSYNAEGKIVQQGFYINDKFMNAKKPTSTLSSKIDGYKSFCSEIGITPGTEKFGECVVEAMKKG